MTRDEMAAVIVETYGPEIRGRKVATMRDEQIYSIYKSIMSRSKKAEHHTRYVKYCATCGMFTGNMCLITGQPVMAETQACTSFYTESANSSGHKN